MVAVATTTNREAIIELGGRIASLREESQRIKQELRAAENELDRLLNPESPSSSVSNSITINSFPERDAERSLNQYLVDILLLMHPADADAEELMRQLPPNTNITSVRSALARLAENKRILRTSRGRYGSFEGVVAGGETHAPRQPDW
jgi:hypothetical protein